MFDLRSDAISLAVSGFNHAIASEVTPQRVYLNRRQLMQAAAAAAGALAWPVQAQVLRPGKRAALPGGRSAVGGALTMEKATSFADATSYNNFYEFGTD